MPVKGRISAVVPVYNAAGYIGKCVDSVLGQSYKDVELILVDDGSADGSAKVIERYLPDARIRFLRQENAGVSKAINRGMALAAGEYISFLGNDDWLEPAAYETMLAALLAAGADVAVCDFNMVYENGEPTKPKYSQTADEVMDLDADLPKYIARCCVNPRSNNYIWSRLYKTEIIRESGLAFETLPIGEDTLFNFKLLPHLRKAVFVKEGFYNYLQRAGSVIHTVAVKKNLAKAYADQFESLADYYTENGYGRFIETLPVIAYTRMRSTFFYSRLSGMSDEEILKSIAKEYAGRQIAAYLVGTR